MNNEGPLRYDSSNKSYSYTDYKGSAPDNILIDPNYIFNIDFVMKANGSYLEFSFDGKGKGGVYTDYDEGYSFLGVPYNTNCQFTLTLPANWVWSFDWSDPVNADPIRFTNSDHAKFYKTKKIDARTICIKSISTGVHPDNVTPDQIHYFNLYAKFEQQNGKPILLRIDPIIKNPPAENDPGGGRLLHSSVPIL